MNRFRPGRFFGVTAGALVILALGLYGPATLLGPLPTVRATVLHPAAAPANPSPPALPTAGASAIIPLDSINTAIDTSIDAAGRNVAEPLAAAGSSDPLPMASAAKLVTALVVLHAKPLEAGRTGPSMTITADDYQGYLDYANEGARTVAVFQGETWTERELLQALILGSSNNHADTVARWAFGSIDAYLVAATTWITEHKLTKTQVVDTNGLHDASAGTAADLASLAGIAVATPAIAELLANPSSALADRRGVDNTTAYLPELGVTGVSRSYTDAAGVCFLFTGQVGEGEAAYRFAGAILGEPDYDTLSADLTALMGSAVAGVQDIDVLAEGDPFVRFDSDWGQTANGVVRASKTRYGWQAAALTGADVKLDPFSTRGGGATVGRVTVVAAGDSVSSPLVLDRAISDPGPGWRLLNPVPVIAALIKSRG
jgi:D-alanyl-D-alanine carboxypeptidase (penicillin-binding protein 5/6)